MRRLISYKSFITEAQIQTKLELSDETKEKYLQTLGKHVTYPEIYEKDPDLWHILVNDDDGEKIEYTSSEFEYTLKELNQMKKDVETKVWGTPQAAFDSFVGCQLYPDGCNYDEEWGDVSNSSIPELMRFFNKSKEICHIVKVLHDGHETINWIEVK